MRVAASSARVRLSGLPNRSSLVTWAEGPNSLGVLKLQQTKADLQIFQADTFSKWRKICNYKIEHINMYFYFYFPNLY